MSKTTITELTVYPIKSTAGVSQTAVQVEPRGLQNDRRWGLFDTSGGVMTARDYPQLLGIQLKPGADGAKLHVSPSEKLDFPLTPLSHTPHTIKVFSEEAQGVEVDPVLSQWFSEFLGEPCRLLFMDEPSRPVAAKRGGQLGDVVSYADECPILLISEASLADLNGRLADPVTMAHFRPNIVVSGCEAFAEDSWTAVQIGDTVFDVAQACKRCVFTTIDPITQEKSPNQEPLRTLATYRQQDGGGIIFGVHLIPRKLGQIAVGQAITPQ